MAQTQPAPRLKIRPAQPSDLPAVHAIQTYYVEHTVMNFSYTAPLLADVERTYAQVVDGGFPFVVAVLGEACSAAAPGLGGAPRAAHVGSSGAATGASRGAAVASTATTLSSADAGDTAPLLCGYAYAHSFRERLAYQHTAELSIFVAPHSTSRGVGTQLVRAVVADLRERSRTAQLIARHGGTRRVRDIRQLMACMSVDPDQARAEQLRRFYEKEGFVETARLGCVGWKFGAWIDVRYMQRPVLDERLAKSEPVRYE